MERVLIYIYFTILILMCKIIRTNKQEIEVLKNIRNDFTSKVIADFNKLQEELGVYKK